MMKKALIASTAVAGLFSGVAAAEMTGNIGVASSYVFRGNVVSDPQVYGGIDYSHASGFYAGTWISSAGGQEEVDFYAGFGLDLGEGLALDMGAITYLFPSDGETSTINTSHGNSNELYVGLGGASWDVYAWYNFGTDNSDRNPDIGDDDDEFAYIEANADLALTEGTSLGLHAGVVIGIGDAFDNNTSLEDAEDGAVDVAISYNVGDFAATVSSKFDDTDVDSDDRNRPHFSVNWRKEFDIK